MKNTLRKWRQAKDWVKIFVNFISNKWIIFRLCEELSKFNNWDTNYTFKNWSKHLNKHFLKRDSMMAKSVCSTLLVIRERQIKVRYHSTTQRKTKLKKKYFLKGWQAFRESGDRVIADWNAKWYSHSEKLVSFL